MRRRGVYELGYRCQWEQEHARQVARLALRLFDACQSLHSLGPAERELLEYAALLHDIGYPISRRSHFQNVERRDIDLADDALTLTLHTHTDPQLDVWGTRRDADLFEYVYDRPVQVRAEGPEQAVVEG